ncbi:hypothetical protein [uncultured Methylobacterium sp.]|uniref:hypothetical protein n=1 Tax=uncultured Methylobacterium sp. TaxID=157278 RepID=UPI002599CEEC|nr:hypothetical protein [uncultured Methylobacterium sp.]
MSTANARDRVFLPHGALRPHTETQLSSVTNWCEYGVWGLTLHDGQPPWFVLIECFQILHSLAKSSTPLFQGITLPDGTQQHEHVEYTVPVNLNLRHLLFRDQEVSKIASKRSFDTQALWEELTKRTKEVDKRNSIDLKYLSSAFDDFDKFAKSLEILRSVEVESFNVSRWTSRHLLPLGPSMLFADVDDTSLSADKRIFRRTGEMLYLMLNRSSDAIRKDLEERVRTRIVDLQHPLNNLAQTLAGPKFGESTAKKPISFSTGYLPMPHMAVYDRLAEDWCSLLWLNSVQLEILLDPLMRLSAFHQITYTIRRAWDEAGGLGEPPPVVFDLSGSARKNPVQRLAADQYENHRVLPRRAVEHLLDRVPESDEWKELLQKSELPRKELAWTHLKERFLWPKQKTMGLATQTLEPEGQRQELLAAFQSATSHTVWTFMAAHAKRAGLVLARQKAGTWYSPSESFLEALVLANVTTPLEFGRFLDRLRKRYGIVVGPEQARQAFEGSLMSFEPFKANQVRLEERLAVLGYIDRKSDDCAFVINPFHDRIGDRREARPTGIAA